MDCPKPTPDQNTGSKPAVGATASSSSQIPPPVLMEGDNPQPSPTNASPDTQVLPATSASSSDDKGPQPAQQPGDTDIGSPSKKRSREKSRFSITEKIYVNENRQKLQEDIRKIDIHKPSDSDQDKPSDSSK